MIDNIQTILPLQMTPQPSGSAYVFLLNTGIKSMGYHDYFLMHMLRVEIRLAALQGEYLTDWVTL